MAALDNALRQDNTSIAQTEPERALDVFLNLPLSGCKAVGIERYTDSAQEVISDRWFLGVPDADAATSALAPNSSANQLTELSEQTKNYLQYRVTYSAANEPMNRPGVSPGDVTMLSQQAKRHIAFHWQNIEGGLFGNYAAAKATATNSARAGSPATYAKTTYNFNTDVDAFGTSAGYSAGITVKINDAESDTRGPVEIRDFLKLVRRIDANLGTAHMGEFSQSGAQEAEYVVFCNQSVIDNLTVQDSQSLVNLNRIYTNLDGIDSKGAPIRATVAMIGGSNLKIMLVGTNLSLGDDAPDASNLDKPQNQIVVVFPVGALSVKMAVIPYTFEFTASAEEDRIGCRSVYSYEAIHHNLIIAGFGVEQDAVPGQTA